MISFLFGLVFSVVFCFLVWNKWTERPVQITMTSLTDQHKTNQFPTVTICSTNKVSRSKLQQIMAADRYRHISYELITETLRHFSRFDILTHRSQELKAAAKILNQYGVDSDQVVDILNRTSPSCDDIIIDCVWDDTFGPCAHLIRQRLTDDGICCSFSPNETDHSAIGSGFVAGLRLTLDSNADDYAVSMDSFDGFAVLLHKPNDFAKVGARGFIAGLGLNVAVGVDLSSIKHTDAVAKLDARQRNCHVKGDGQLKYFNNYSYSACMTECIIAAMIDRCKCLPYFFRQFDLHVPHCQIESYSCTGKVYGKYWSI